MSFNFFRASPRLIEWYRGEPGVGKWTIVVKDTVVNQHSGTFTDWRMTLWGEAIDGTNQKLYPMPTDEDDDDHDEDDEETKPISAVVSTTSITVGSSSTLAAKPTDHVDRPVNNKPAATTTAAGTVSSVISSTTTTTTTTSSATAASDTTPTPTPTFFLPSIFPTFGVSPRTQIWIYGAIAAILIFCIALGIFFCVQRRRRARVNRADYEFEMVNDEDAEGAGEPLSGDGVRRKRRAGELYDAFAGESDEEIFSEGEDNEYKDEPDEKRRARGESPGQEYSEKHR